MDNAIFVVITLLLLMGVGYAMSWKGWLTNDNASFLSKLVINVGLPALVIKNVTQFFTLPMLASAGIGLIVPFLAIAVSYAFAYLLTHILKVSPKRRGVFCAMFAFSNTVFIGLPVNQALFGEMATPLALLYFIGNTTLFWTIGIYGIRNDGAPDSHKNAFRQNLKRILSPALAAFVVGLIIMALNWKMPKPLEDICNYLGALPTPLSLIFIGHVLHRTGLKSLRFNRDMVFILLGRFALTPVLAFGLVSVLDIPVLMKQVFIVQAAMPVMSQIPILAQAYHADAEFASSTMAVTTILSILVVPLEMALMIWMGGG